MSNKDRVNPKLIISEYYDYLVNQIDIYTEELLEKYNENDLLQEPLDIYAEHKECQQLREFKESLFRPYNLPVIDNCVWLSDPYKEDYEITDMRSAKFTPEVTKTRDYINQTRDEMIQALDNAKAATFAFYETIKEDLKPDEMQGTREEIVNQLKGCLFANKYSCIIRIDWIQIDEEWNDGDDNSSIFKLYLFIFDFYINNHEMSIFKNMIETAFNVRIYHEKSEETAEGDKTNLNKMSTEFNRKVFLLHLTKCYMISLFKQTKPFIHVFHISRENLFSIARADVEYFSIDFTRIVLDQNESLGDKDELCSLKSLKISRKQNIMRNNEEQRSEFVSLSALRNLEYLSLEFVNLFNASFENLIHLKQIDIDNADFGHFESRSFRFVSNLEVLRMHNCSNFSHVDFSLLRHLRMLEIDKATSYEFLLTLNESVEVLKTSVDMNYEKDFLSNFRKISTCYPKVLDLQIENAFKFDVSVLSRQANLRHFILRDFGLDRFNYDHDFFANLESLTIQTSVPEISFSKMINLKKLAIVGHLNLNFKLYPRMFSPLKNLEFLEISASRLINAHLDAPNATEYFEGLHQLKTLDLSRNSIESLNYDLFVHMPNLETLRLSSNELACPSCEEAFRHLSNLKYLDLSHNSIVSIQNNAFRLLANLEILRLEHNQVANIDAQAFNGLKTLRFLFLNHNEIDHYDPYVFLSMPMLERVVLDLIDIENQEEFFNFFQSSSISFLFNSIE